MYLAHESRPVNRASELQASLERRENRAIRHLPEWVRCIVRDAAEKHSVRMSDILSPSRARAVVRARCEALYFTKDSKPWLSSSQLGKWFGRDHTSVLFSIARHSEHTGATRLTTYDLAAHRGRRPSHTQVKRATRA